MSVVINPRHHCSGEIRAVFLDGLCFFFLIWGRGGGGRLLKKKKRKEEIKGKKKCK